MDKDSWPAKLMSSEYPAYTWPHGARALQAERVKVQKVLDLSAGMSNGKCPGRTIDNVVFKVPLGFHEGFVRNDTERITLIDRVRTYHNFNWKRDVRARPCIQPFEVELTYHKVIDNLLELQAITEELKPETLVLVASCASANELQQAMLNARA